jgi:hypothetical protein
MQKSISKFILIICCLFTSFQLKAEGDSCRLRVSLLTITPGAELYSVFGHSALRVIDSTIGTDIVYNYGTFNFDDPDFYSKFVRGKLMYFLSQESFTNFMYEYQYFGRGVNEQVFDLTCEEKNKLQAFMFNNMAEGNRYYKYDFLKDNCSTRLRDIIFRKGQKDAIRATPLLIGSSTYRDHLHVYLDRAGMEWTKLGIDLLLGMEADHQMDANESMFLPDFLQSGLQGVKVGSRNLVNQEGIILKDMQPTPTAPSFWTTPLFVFILVMIFYFSLAAPRMARIRKIHRISDNVLFFITGILGCILTFMWFGTDHQSFGYNLDLVWAMPFNLPVAFMLNKKNTGIKYYLRGFSVLQLILLFLIFLMPGIINLAVAPLIVALSFRSWMISKEV